MTSSHYNVFLCIWSLLMYLYLETLNTYLESDSKYKTLCDRIHLKPTQTIDDNLKIWHLEWKSGQKGGHGCITNVLKHQSQDNTRNISTSIHIQQLCHQMCSMEIQSQIFIHTWRMSRSQCDCTIITFEITWDNTKYIY